MKEVGIVHLVRRKNGIAPFERFLASYKAHPAGLDHDLILIFKGFPSGQAPADYDRLLAGVAHGKLFLPDRGFDLGPYFKAVELLEYAHFCFLNSFSRILDDDWLAKLHRWATAQGVGLVGATGSYQSFATAHADREATLRSLRPGERLRRRVRHVLSDPQPRLVAQRAGAWALGALGAWDTSRHFAPFPNYHVRTNAFMAARATMLRIRLGPMRIKLEAHMLESGRNSLTQQVFRLGLRALVVAKTGQAYEKECWHQSDTFRQANQKDLLVADNQTDAYADASPAERAELSRFAWGEFARPA